MSWRRQYYMLIGSLPALPSHFADATRQPISRLLLRDRLRLLNDEAALALDQLADFLVWDRQPLDRTDQEVCQRYEQFIERARHRFTVECIEDAMAMRTIVSALRRRRLGAGPPPGVGPVAQQIARHWSHPDFRLAPRVPWIPRVSELLEGPTPMELEWTLLDIKWRRASRQANRHHFSFEAVVLYFLRWEIVYRWLNRDAVVGQQRFDQLVDHALAPHATLFPATNRQPHGLEPAGPLSWQAPAGGSPTAHATTSREPTP